VLAAATAVTEGGFLRAGGSTFFVAFSPAGQGVSAIAISNVQLLDSALSPIVFMTVNGEISTTTPEPGSFLLLCCGLAALCLARRRC
jgi:hypothetical protein